ncbi:hypothetical protein CXU05_05480 [Akkermansia muciniphila]|nr:hypothetical protein CXU05_05480 [Akkermansia muciniphila]
MVARVLSGTEHFTRAGSLSSGGDDLFYPCKEWGSPSVFLRPALSRVRAEKTRFPLFAGKGIVVS